jgi:hypothetical protein
VSHIPSFEGGSPISAIPVSARSLSVDSVDSSPRGPSAGSLKTQVGKHKAKVTAAQPPPLKARKVLGSSDPGWLYPKHGIM